MDWQLALVMGIVLVALGYLGLRLQRRWKGGSCAPGCGCGTAGAAAENQAKDVIITEKDLLSRLVQPQKNRNAGH